MLKRHVLRQPQVSPLSSPSLYSCNHVDRALTFSPAPLEVFERDPLRLPNNTVTVAAVPVIASVICNPSDGDPMARSRVCSSDSDSANECPVSAVASGAVSAVVVREISARRLKHRRFDNIRHQRESEAIRHLGSLVKDGYSGGSADAKGRIDRVCILLAAANTIHQMTATIHRLDEENERKKIRLMEAESASTFLLSAPSLSPSIVAWMRPYTPGPLTTAEINHFYQFGYVIKENIIPTALLHAAMAAINSQVDELANSLQRNGAVVNTHSDADFYHRLTLLEQEFPSAAVLLHRYGVLAPAFAQLWNCEELLAVAHQIIGPIVGAHPNWALRCKLPSDEASTLPLHQDAAYLQPDADSTLQLTAWIPFIHPDVRHSSIQVIRGGQRTGNVARHIGCAGDTWYLEADESSMADALQVDLTADLITCEVPFGGVLFLSNLLPFRSPPNHSDEIRWSLDLRYQDPAKPSGTRSKPVLQLSGANHRATAEEWWEWSHQDRHAILRNKTGDELHRELFNATHCGPWMDRWELIHQNRHTMMWKKVKEERELKLHSHQIQEEQHNNDAL